MRWHFVITVQSGDRQYTLHGDLTAPRGATRTEVFKDVRAKAAANLGAPDAVVLFWSLEPDVLEG